MALTAHHPTMLLAQDPLFLMFKSMSPLPNYQRATVCWHCPWVHRQKDLVAACFHSDFPPLLLHGPLQKPDRFRVQLSGAGRQAALLHQSGVMRMLERAGLTSWFLHLAACCPHLPPSRCARQAADLMQ